MKSGLTLPEGTEAVTLSRTYSGHDIELYQRGGGTQSVLLIGGVHGDESEGYLLAERYLSAIDKGDVELDDRLRLYVCPRLNPDGCAANRRTNHHNVDLNRNLPTKDWRGDFTNVRYYPGASAASEVESKVTIDLIEAIDPKVIISLHSYEHAMVNFNGPCEDLAQAMSEKNGLPPKGDIGYPTPGSLGTYAGWERNIPTITLEVLRGQSPAEAWEQHRDGLTTGLSYYLDHAHPSAQR